MVTEPAFYCEGADVSFDQVVVLGEDVAIRAEDCNIAIRDSNFVDVRTVLKGNKLKSLTAERVKQADSLSRSSHTYLAFAIRRAIYGYV